MAEYTRITETINAFLVNAASAADDLNWPIWILDITASVFGTWIVRLSTGEIFEIQDGAYVSTNADGDVLQRSADDISAYEIVT
jgi:hypothetical protein